MSSPPFKVVIVGGGPIGITAAHALHRAGIDFVVLEGRQNVLVDSGAALVLSPHNLRVYHQLGLLERIKNIGVPFLHLTRAYGQRTMTFRRSYALTLLQENHGSSIVACHRANVVETLYNGLPDDAKKRYFLGKKVVDIKVNSANVEVSCADGTLYSGDIVIGADGAHSRARAIMRQLALQADPSQASTWDPEKPFTSYYKCLWASFPRPSDPGDSYETQGSDRSLMYLTGRDKGWVMLYEKLPKPVSERVSYDEKEKSAFAHSFAKWPINEKLTVEDVLPNIFTMGMANLEEGIANNWSWGGKIVLVGDAAHKFTPNSGLGFNNGVQDVVSLCNRLRAAVVSKDGSPTVHPDTTVLQKVFEDYQSERQEPLEGDYKQSANTTRLQSWASWLYYLLARYVLSFEFVEKYLTNTKAAPAVANGLILDYIKASEPFNGKVAWKRPLQTS